MLLLPIGLNSLIGIHGEGLQYLTTQTSKISNEQPFLHTLTIKSVASEPCEIPVHVG